MSIPPKLLLAKLLAAKLLAAYRGYASTRKVNMPLNTSRTLIFPAVSNNLMQNLYNVRCI